MTTPSSADSQGARDNFDAGPLSWVMGEVRDALGRSKTALHEAVAQDAEAQVTTLRHAKNYLHQAHGALQIVDIDGIAIITETVEDLLDRVDSKQLSLSENLAQTIGTAYQALVEYLEELLSGASHQPVRLFPYYRSLLEARGAERIHPADLFFPNLTIRTSPSSDQSTATLQPAELVSLRQRFERALLPFLKSTDRKAELASAATMRDIIAQIEAAQENPQSRGFWWVMHGFADVVAEGQIQSEVYVKQLFARINLQIRRLCQGSASIAERLLRDALFFIARASKPSKRAQQIRVAYELDGTVPTDYDKKRYGQVDVDALAVAKEKLSQAKNLWNRIAGGDTNAAALFQHEMHGLNEAGAKLGSEPLAKLLREINGIARHAAHAQPGDALGLEMATGLLFIENSLNHISRLSDDFGVRADAMTARLLSVVAGQKPTDSAQWLDEMSRTAQERQTMTALAGEMQSSLRQVEKMLDEFFRDPSQRTALSQLDGILRQVEGALAVLDQDDARRTVQHTRSAVQRFAEASDDTADEAAYQKVAQNVGALSFFLETLQLHPEGAKKRFSFDAQQGLFRANLVEKKNPLDPETPALEYASGTGQGGLLGQAAPGGSSITTVEDELAFFEKQSAELAISLTEEPNNPQLHEQLKESLEKIRMDAALVDDTNAKDRAETGIEILQHTDFVASQDALAPIIQTSTPAQTAPAPVAAPVVPASEEAVDAELLEIFLFEAEEVLACVNSTLPESRNQPHNQEHLTTLRRSFHTLKGSGRMVGLVAFGEAAWSIEQVLNLRLADARPGDADLYALLQKAAELLGEWVVDLQTKGGSDRTPDALVAAAERVKAGEPFRFEEQAVSSNLSPENNHPSSLPELPAIDFADDVVPTATQELDHQAAVESNASSEQAMDAELPAILPEVEEVALSDADMAMFHMGDHIDAASSVESVVHSSAPREEPLPVVSVAEVIEFPTMPAVEAKLNDNVKRIGGLEISLPLHNIYLSETDELMRVLAREIAEWRHEPERQVNILAVHAAHSLAGSSATVGFKILHELAHPLEMILQFVSRTPVTLTTYEFDALETSVGQLRAMLEEFATGEMPAHDPEYARLLVDLLKDIEARSTVQAPTSGSKEMPVTLKPVVETRRVQEVDPPLASVSPIKPDATVLNLNKGPSFVEPAPANESVSRAETTVAIKDELDADLLPVFLEEGRDMLPEMGQVFRAWQNQLSSTEAPQALLRILHTLKGSARMAGAMTLGQHLHEMESRIENLMRLGVPSGQAVEDLVARYDHALHLFDLLENPNAVQEPPKATAFTNDLPKTTADQAEKTVAASSVATIQAAAPAPMNAPVKPATPAAGQVASNTPLVRVRADILDRLVNQAGEVSISRSKIETDVGTLKQSLSELTDNVNRLRGQLREIEIQAETQIASSMAQSGDREFDPLEFDRFTRLQELTRMMAESVNDVGSVQYNLARTLDSATGDLLNQARLTRDLQQDLMRVRMVQFASVSERLFRVARQAAKEVDKRVNLDIRGTSVEIDRGVLEKMSGPFEHLLRNAIVHGIESREARRAAGKSEIGELLVEIRQEGNEVVIQFSDDGQGLNIGRIRDKAKRVGLLTNDTDMTDEEVKDLIFHPGFSTADEVTELAGRGVGMDVVRSEATTLGGRIAARSEPGKGAHFTITLPLTLAVTQVVLLSTGGKTYAVPSVLVEQVQQLKVNALATAYNEGAIMMQGQRVPMYYLSTLLGDATAAPTSQMYSPLIILKSGSERVALHVDEIMGNREVVVKNIGPQLARMIGVAGATVLGSGDIVLILNPIPLAQRSAQDNIRAPRLTPSDAPQNMGAVMQMTSASKSVPTAEPVQGLRTQNIVMVVDDSLTVRRVTQRLLSREGYQVVLAKDGVDALEQLQSVTPDVMLVDIEMPRMDGFDLTRNVRGDERTRQIPIIMITSRTAEKHRNYAMELGVNQYLGKPYREDELLQYIGEFVKKETSAH